MGQKDKRGNGRTHQTPLSKVTDLDGVDGAFGDVPVCQALACDHRQQVVPPLPSAGVVRSAATLADPGPTPLSPEVSWHLSFKR